MDREVRKRVGRADEAKAGVVMMSKVEDHGVIRVGIRE